MTIQQNYMEPCTCGDPLDSIRVDRTWRIVSWKCLSCGQTSQIQSYLTRHVLYTTQKKHSASEQTHFSVNKRNCRQSQPELYSMTTKDNESFGLTS